MVNMFHICCVLDYLMTLCQMSRLILSSGMIIWNYAIGIMQKEAAYHVMCSELTCKKIRNICKHWSGRPVSVPKFGPSISNSE